jgi:hypothetical protein
MQREQYCIAEVICAEGDAMKVELAARYRGWMFALFPATLGLGTAALWLRSRNWPLMIDETGVRLRSHRYVGWASITKLSVSRNYLDGHVSHIRMHHAGGITKVPVGGLEDGQSVASAMIFMFKRTNGDKDREEAEGAMDGIVPPERRAAPGRPSDTPSPTFEHPAKAANHDAILEFKSLGREAVRGAVGQHGLLERPTRQEQT